MLLYREKVSKEVDSVRYNMLIAEDEQDEFELVIYLLKKLNLESEFQIFYAKNGKQAMEYLEKEKIDLLFTDIEMPFSNGLEIAVKAREKNEELPIIFFSCYDDFSYVKTALSVKACNYLLKPLDPTEFEKTMQQALGQIHDFEKDSAAREKRRNFIKNHYLYQNLAHGINDTEHLKEVGISEKFTEEYKRILLLYFDTPFFDQSQDDEDQFAAFLGEMYGEEAELVNLNSSQSVLFLKTEDDEKKLEKLCEMVREKISRKYQAECYFVVSSPLSAGYPMKAAYEDAVSLLETRFFYQKRYVFLEKTEPLLADDSEGKYTAVFQEIKADCEEQNLAKLQEDIRRLNRIFERNENFSHIFVRYAYSQVVQVLCKKRDAQELQQWIEKIFACSFIWEIERIIEELLRLSSQNFVSEEDEKNQAIVLVKQYIAEHYMEQLSLTDLAEQVYLNASYLSTRFKLETGYGINEYIKKLRMEKAKQMLKQTNKKVNTIAQEVGFLNTSYFIRSFHEYYGQTPAKIRQK